MALPCKLAYRLFDFIDTGILVAASPPMDYLTVSCQ